MRKSILILIIILGAALFAVSIWWLVDNSQNKKVTDFNDIPQNSQINVQNSDQSVVYYDTTASGFKRYYLQDRKTQSLAEFPGISPEYSKIVWGQDGQKALVYGLESIAYVDVNSGNHITFNQDWRNVEWLDQSHVIYSEIVDADEGVTKNVYSYDLNNNTSKLLLSRKGSEEDQLAVFKNHIVIMEGATDAVPINLLVFSMAGKQVFSKKMDHAEILRPFSDNVFMVQSNLISVLSVDSKNSFQLSQAPIKVTPGNVQVVNNKLYALDTVDTILRIYSVDNFSQQPQAINLSYDFSESYITSFGCSPDAGRCYATTSGGKTLEIPIK